VGDWILSNYASWLKLSKSILIFLLYFSSKFWSQTKNWSGDQIHSCLTLYQFWTHLLVADKKISDWHYINEIKMKYSVLLYYQFISTNWIKYNIMRQKDKLCTTDSVILLTTNTCTRVGIVWHDYFSMVLL
jgi:hypothetical protein